MSDAAQSFAPQRRLLPAPVLLSQRTDRRAHWLDRIEASMTELPSRLWAQVHQARIRRQVLRVCALEQTYAALSETELAATVARLRAEQRRRGLEDRDTVVHTLALIREVSRRTLGLCHYPSQLTGGLVMLSGRIAEMDTGEGKTLTAPLAAGVAAFSGLPTHVMTVNDYLAQRDADLMAPLYRRLGLTVGVVRAGMTPDERRAAYRADITYGSNSEMAFDYLRDRQALGRRSGNLLLKVEALRGGGDDVVMRGLHFAIVDEADSILIDEARTPLIIARETAPEEERRWAEGAFALADSLREGEDFTVHQARRMIELSRRGRARLEAAGLRRGGLWEGRIRREESVRQALSAQLLFQRGEHYLLRDGAVHIVDEYSGRVLEGRSWNQGLHQLIEYKEGVEVTGRKTTLARTSFQKFFRRYHRLCGMTGTAREVRAEMRAVYRLGVTRVQPNRRSRRRVLPTRLLPGLADKRRAIALRAAELRGQGRPVLIGTRSVQASQELSEVLRRRDVPHEVLNAESEAEEAEIIARAGRAGQVTIATNMAGRGVDIALAEGVEAAGGLHVILSECHDSARIDRQLAGRCARQGERGSVEAILSCEDPLVAARRGERFGFLRAAGLQLAPSRVFAFAQWRAQRDYARIRRSLIRSDEEIGSMLSFAGDPE